MQDNVDVDIIYCVIDGRYCTMLCNSEWIDFLEMTVTDVT